MLGLATNWPSRSFSTDHLYWQRTLTACQGWTTLTLVNQFSAIWSNPSARQHARASCNFSSTRS